INHRIYHCNNRNCNIWFSWDNYNDAPDYDYVFNSYVWIFDGDDAGYNSRAKSITTKIDSAWYSDEQYNASNCCLNWDSDSCYDDDDSRTKYSIISND